MNSSAAESIGSAADVHWVHGQFLSFIQWRIQGRGLGGPGNPLFLDQTEPRRAEIFFFLETGSPLPYLRVWMSWTPPYLKVWIRHCYFPPKLLQYVAFAVILRSHGRAEAGGHKQKHILLSKYINSHDSFYWQIFHEPLTLDILMHIKNKFLRLMPVQKNIS